MGLSNKIQIAQDVVGIIPVVQTAYNVPLAAYNLASIIDSVADLAVRSIMESYYNSKSKSLKDSALESNTARIKYLVDSKVLTKERLQKSAKNLGISLLRAIPIVGTIYSAIHLHKVLNTPPAMPPRPERTPVPGPELLPRNQVKTRPELPSKEGRPGLEDTAPVVPSRTGRPKLAAVDPKAHKDQLTKLVASQAQAIHV